jgi:aryl-alcohol dehydrogenase-like predicted oxidoreductase
MTRITRRTFIETAAAAAGTSLVASAVWPLESPVAAAGAIPTRAFGKTGVQVSIAGLGGGGRFFEPVPTDEAGAELVRQAIDRGITFIETCVNYGLENDGNRSERRIGLAMKTHRAKAFLETKTDQRDFDGAMKEVERSLKLLATDRIDLLLHHNLSSAKELDQIAGPNGAERAIRKLVNEKVIRFRGFSCHDPKLTMEAIERLGPDAIQAPINATRIPDFETGVLPLTKARGIAVVVMKAVGHGFFLKGVADGSLDSRFKTDKNRSCTGTRRRPARSRAGCQRGGFLRYAMSLPVATVLAGIDRPRRRQALRRLDVRATRAEAEDIPHAGTGVRGTGIDPGRREKSRLWALGFRLGLTISAPDCPHPCRD